MLDYGLAVYIEFNYGVPCLVCKELRKNAAKDSATERFIYNLVQSGVVILWLYGESQPYMMDGPDILIELINKGMQNMSRKDVIKQCIETHSVFNIEVCKESGQTLGGRVPYTFDPSKDMCVYEDITDELRVNGLVFHINDIQAVGIGPYSSKGPYS